MIAAPMASIGSSLSISASAGTVAVIAEGTMVDTGVVVMAAVIRTVVYAVVATQAAATMEVLVEVAAAMEMMDEVMSIVVAVDSGRQSLVPTCVTLNGLMMFTKDFPNSNKIST